MTRRKLTEGERSERRPYQPGTKEKALHDLGRYMDSPNELMVRNDLAGRLESTRGMNVSITKMYEDGGHKLRVIQALTQRAREVKPPRDKAEVFQYLEGFLAFCGDNYIPPTIGLFAVWCGVTVTRIAQIERDNKDIGRSEAFSVAKEVMRGFLEVSAMDSTINPIVYFHQNKVYYGAVENQQVNLRVETNEADISSEEYQVRVSQLLEAENGNIHDSA